MYIHKTIMHAVLRMVISMSAVLINHPWKNVRTCAIQILNVKDMYNGLLADAILPQPPHVQMVAKNMILEERDIWEVNVEETTTDATSRIVIQQDVLMVVVVQLGKVALCHPELFKKK